MAKGTADAKRAGKVDTSAVKKAEGPKPSKKSPSTKARKVGPADPGPIKLPKSEHVSKRKIDNGWLVSHSKDDGKGGYSSREMYSADEPKVGVEALRRAEGKVKNT